MLETRNSSSLHVRQYCLSEMPTQKLINRSKRIFTKLLIEMFTGDVLSILVKDNDFIIVLKQLLAA